MKSLIIMATLLCALTTDGWADRRIASWYNLPGKVMANGKFFDPHKFTSATRDFPLGSYLKLTAGNKSVVVKVTDRINKRYAGKRIDLTPTAFIALGAPLSKGLIDVIVERR